MITYIIVQVKTSYAKIDGKYEVVSVVVTEFPLNEGEEIPPNEWVNEYLELEYYYKEAL